MQKSLGTHIVDPADVAADSGEDRGLLGVVAAQAGAEAHNSVDIPGAIRVATVQGATRVSLKDGRGATRVKARRNTQSLRRQCKLPHDFISDRVIRLTLQLASSPSPPAQIMLVVTIVPHQSGLLQVECPTTGRRACCRISAMGPPALEENCG